MCQWGPFLKLFLWFNTEAIRLQDHCQTQGRIAYRPLKELLKMASPMKEQRCNVRYVFKYISMHQRIFMQLALITKKMQMISFLTSETLGQLCGLMWILYTFIHSDTHLSLHVLNFFLNFFILIQIQCASHEHLCTLKSCIILPCSDNNSWHMQLVFKSHIFMVVLYCLLPLVQIIHHCAPWFMRHITLSE